MSAGISISRLGHSSNRGLSPPAGTGSGSAPPQGPAVVRISRGKAVAASPRMLGGPDRATSHSAISRSVGTPALRASFRSPYMLSM